MIGNHAGDLYKVKLLIVLLIHDISQFCLFLKDCLKNLFTISGHEIGTEKNEGDTDQTTLIRSV